MKKQCVFCGRNHGTKIPYFCRAKADIVQQRAPRLNSKEFWAVLHGKPPGGVDLDGEAIRLLQARGKQLAVA